jgi:hypothetical protein
MILRSPIPPTDLRDYAKAKGWVLLKEAAKDRLYVLNHPNVARSQLVFPMDTTAPDYREAVDRVVEKLAGMEGRPVQAVLKSLLEVGDDSIAFKVDWPRSEDQSLPLAFVGSMLEGAQQMLLASVCTVLKPQIHHPRLSRSEAQQFIESARFRHTQPGSFVLNVSCPVNAMDMDVPLITNEQAAPFVRRATTVLHRSLTRLVGAIETDSLAALVETEQASDAPLISANFCEALTRFEDRSLHNSMEIGITWAASIAAPSGEKSVSGVRVQNDYFSRIEEVRRELRSAEKHAEDVFIGTVERLDGEMGPDGRRDGSRPYPVKRRRLCQGRQGSHDGGHVHQGRGDIEAGSPTAAADKRAFIRADLQISCTRQRCGWGQGLTLWGVPRGAPVRRTRRTYPRTAPPRPPLSAALRSGRDQPAGGVCSPLLRSRDPAGADPSEFGVGHA